jgi:hypothetical protein
VQQRVEGARGLGMQAVLACQLLQRAVGCWLALSQPRVLYDVSNPSSINITQQSTGHNNRTTAPCWECHDKLMAAPGPVSPFLARFACSGSLMEA